MRHSRDILAVCNWSGFFAYGRTAQVTCGSICGEPSDPPHTVVLRGPTPPTAAGQKPNSPGGCCMLGPIDCFTSKKTEQKEGNQCCSVRVSFLRGQEGATVWGSLKLPSPQKGRETKKIRLVGGGHMFSTFSPIWPKCLTSNFASSPQEHTKLLTQFPDVLCAAPIHRYMWTVLGDWGLKMTLCITHWSRDTQIQRVWRDVLSQADQLWTQYEVCREVRRKNSLVNHTFCIVKIIKGIYEMQILKIIST